MHETRNTIHTKLRYNRMLKASLDPVGEDPVAALDALPRRGGEQLSAQDHHPQLPLPSL